MLDCDDTNWPIAITVVEEVGTLADHRRFLEHWGSWLDRAQPFVLLRIFVCRNAMIELAEASRQSQKWLVANAARVRALVPAIAVSVPPGQPVRTDDYEFYDALGVPTRWFDNSKTAVAWLQQDILAPIGMHVDNL